MMSTFPSSSLAVARPQLPTSYWRDVYDLGFSFFSFHNADRPTPDTLTTLKRTPGISPLALPLRPKPARRTSSFSSTKFKQPSLGTATVLARHACQSQLHPPPHRLSWAMDCGCTRRTESSDLLSVLDQLHPDALSDSGVRLLGLDTDLLEDDALGVRGTTEGRRLVCGAEETLLVVEIGPAAVTAVVSQLARGVETSRLACSGV